jgi:hypothetical protein
MILTKQYESIICRDAAGACRIGDVCRNSGAGIIRMSDEEIAVRLNSCRR